MFDPGVACEDRSGQRARAQECRECVGARISDPSLAATRSSKKRSRAFRPCGCHRDADGHAHAAHPDRRGDEGTRMGRAELQTRGRIVGHHTEAFLGIDTSRSRNAIAIADGGGGGEVQYLGEFPATEAAIRKLVAKLAAKYRHLTFCYEEGRQDMSSRQAVARGRAHRGVGAGRAA